MYIKKPDAVQIKTILSLVVIAIGLLSSIGWLSKSDAITRLGLSSTISPLPLPFIDHRGWQENFANTITFNISLKNGQERVVTGNKLYIKGPHKRKIPYIGALIFAPAQNQQIKQTLNYAFCSSERPVARELGIEEEIESVRITGNSKTPGHPDHWEVELICAF